ncbi:MAG: DUF1194 domain-containing protein [Aestuariivirgaceae bacterium]
MRLMKAAPARQFGQACLVVLIATGLLLAWPGRTGINAQGMDVDLALVLAIDCSYSVDDREFRLQMDGMAAAFRTPEVQRAIAEGQIGKIAVSVALWSSHKFQKVSVPWTIVANPADAEKFARIIEKAPRSIPVAGTSVSEAMRFSAKLLRAAPVNARRQVIDVSSDGRNNSGVAPPLIRDQLAAGGITINALVVPSQEWTVLDKWFERNVVGGPFHFVIIADTYDDYAEAIYRKLLREITGPGIS